MYKIDRKNDKPNIEGMVESVQKMSDRGIRIADCKGLMEEYKRLIEGIESEFKDKYGVSNVRSTKQLTWYLRKLSENVGLGEKNDILEICYDAENDKWTTEAQAMESLADLGYEFARDLLDYRHAKKYLDSISELIRLSDSEKLVHPEISLTKTNRISYTKPGLMNIPKKLLWKLIEPYNTNNILYSVDIKNQEPSILINMTRAESLKPALISEEGLYETMFKQCFTPLVVANILVDTLEENREYTASELRKINTIPPLCYASVKPDITGYMVNGKKIIGMETKCIGAKKGLKPNLPSAVSVMLEDKSYVSLEVDWDIKEVEKRYKKEFDYSVIGQLRGVDVTIDKIERNEFKRSWLAISYGAGIKLIEQMCRHIDGKRVYHYITSIEAIKEYRKNVADFAKKGINTINTVFGTRLHAGIMTKAQLKRTLLDIPIQGSGADILSLLIKHFEEHVENNELQNSLMLYYTRHDELIIEIDKDYYNKVGKNNIENSLKDLFEHQVDDWVPFKVEIKQVGSLRQRLGLVLEEDDD